MAGSPPTDEGLIFRHAQLLRIKACVFGDRFMAFSFKKAAHNQYISEKDIKVPWYEHIKYAFENLAEDDLLLTAQVDFHCYAWDPNQDDEDELEVRPQLPNSFFVRVMMRYQQLISVSSDENTLKTCPYHLHDTEEERKACPSHRKAY